MVGLTVDDMGDSGLHNHIIRSSDIISIPENQPELDTLIPALYNFLFALNVLTCACGTVGNLLTLLVICARFVNIIRGVIWFVSSGWEDDTNGKGEAITV